MTRLYTRIYLHFLAMLLLVGITTSFILASGWKREMRMGMIQRLTTHVASLVAEKWDDPPARDALLGHLSKELGVDLSIADDGGERLLASAGASLPLPRGEDREAAKGGFCTYVGGRGKQHRWCAAAPVVGSNGVVLGMLVASPQHRFERGMLIRPILGVAVTLLVIGLASAPLARRISRPVDRLTAATKRFGSGDLAYRIPTQPCGPGRRDELGDLTRAWNEMAERVERLVGGHRELLANVSHELRSPLARIRVALELVPDSARLKDIETDLTELDQLIETILTTSRLEASSLPLTKERIDARAILTQLAERASHAGTKIEVTGDALEIEADPALLKRALWNLVENATKYGAPPIRLSLEKTAAGAAFTVSDEGAGIPREDRERVFAPFFRGDKARTPSQGFGLGLTLARRVAEAHGGTIQVADRPTGCAIVLEIPA